MFTVESVNKVMSIENDSLIMAFPLQELSGNAIDRSVNRDNGTVDGATQNNDRTDKGAPAYTFDGLNDGIDIDTAAANCGVWKNGSAFITARISDSGVWTDGTARDILNLRGDGDNFIRLRRVTTNNQLNWRIKMSTVLDSYTETTAAPTTWFTMGLTWQDADGDGDIFFYYNGAQIGTTNTAAVWNAAVPIATGGIGIDDAGAAAYFSGSIGPCYAWNKRLTGAQIAMADKFMRG
jgi:hypothetical protein